MHLQAEAGSSRAFPTRKLGLSHGNPVVIKLSATQICQSGVYAQGLLTCYPNPDLMSCWRALP
jgi:hypothetical protein